MATAASVTPAAAPRTSRRGEILERYSALPRQTDCQVLGVGAGADGRAVREAYQRLARRFHPDTLDPDSRDLATLTQAIFVRATAAYQALMTGRPEPAPIARRRVARPVPVEHREVPPAPHPAARPSAPRLAPATAARQNPAPRPRLACAQDPARATPGPPPVDEVIGQARHRLDEGDARGAVGLLHGVLARCGAEDHRRVRLLLARGYVQEAKWRRYAVAQLRSLIAEHPNDAEALVLLGTLYHREGLLARAESLLSRALAADPGLDEARSGLRLVRAERAETRADRFHPPPLPSTFWKRMFSRKA